MDDIQRVQLNKLNQKLVNGGELTEVQKQLRNELSALQSRSVAAAVAPTYIAFSYVC